jgi:hypothetical protein
MKLMKYRNLLLHSCWSIYFWLLNSNLCLNFCLFFLKNRKPFLPSVPVSCAAHLPKSGRARSAPPLVHLRTLPLLSPACWRPSAAQLRVPSPAVADGRVPPVIPHLGLESDRGRDPESALHAPLAAGPHAKEPPGSIKLATSHRAALSPKTLAPELAASDAVGAEYGPDTNQ